MTVDGTGNQSAMLINRRRLLAAAPLGLAPLALAPAAAGAFRLEPAEAGVAAAYDEACRALEAHEALRIELDRLMEGRRVPQEALPRLGALARCPFCGCSVLGAADHGEGASRPQG
jgi:hypothetical protein